MKYTRAELEPRGRARPHAWPDDRQLPEDGDSYWVRLGLHAPRPAGGPPVDLREHWEIVMVTWCPALVPAQAMVQRSGAFGLCDCGVVEEWGPSVGVTPLLPTREVPTCPGTYWVICKGGRTWEPMQASMTTSELFFNDGSEFAFRSSEIEWFCGPLPEPPLPRSG